MVQATNIIVFLTWQQQVEIAMLALLESASSQPICKEMSFLVLNIYWTQGGMLYTSYEFKPEMARYD